ncbi:E3 ubiquitin-protein ligase RNF185 isoform X1 [Lates japonicus]|uniref:E3 ubiquitin-protein ligase RNF185 n=1 Tax=Lates japonicus TaxID=270547 RepID=A0AAD3NKB7_LATJO|nr:E3 ubiquitin-protein ligase RNF185 isoform X1 [Lates japonicus]
MNPSREPGEESQRLRHLFATSPVLHELREQVQTQGGGTGLDSSVGSDLSPHGLRCLCSAEACERTIVNKAHACGGADWSFSSVGSLPYLCSLELDLNRHSLRYFQTVEGGATLASANSSYPQFYSGIFIGNDFKQTLKRLLTSRIEEYGRGFQTGGPNHSKSSRAPPSTSGSTTGRSCDGNQLGSTFKWPPQPPLQPLAPPRPPKTRVLGPAARLRHQDSTFECNICLDTAKDAVISLCGHLFCWPCLHQWLETRPNRQVCPVCKAGISRDKVIPLYGRGSTGQQDPRERTPPRPQGQRPEPENRGGFQGFGFGDGGFQMSFGIGAFPFGIFATAFNINDGRPPPAAPGTPQHMDEQFLSRLFLFVALVIMFWLLIA